MKIFKLVKHDMIEGTLKCFYKNLFCVIVVAAWFAIYNVRLRNGIQYGVIEDTGTLMDYIIYITKGEAVYNFSPRDTFTIPLYWFAFQIGISYIIAYYPKNDIDGYGKKVILAASSRNRWWLSKCIWCILTVLIYYISAFFTIIVMCLLNGIEISFELSDDIISNYYTDNVSELNSSTIYIIAILIPVLVTVAVSLLQVLLSFIVSPVISFAGVCTIYILSAYYTKTYFIGNYTMWLRSSYVEAGGLDSGTGLIISMIIILSCVTFGSMYFDKKDII